MTGAVNNITVRIYGTKDKPEHYKDMKRYGEEMEIILEKKLSNPNVSYFYYHSFQVILLFQM